MGLVAVLILSVPNIGIAVAYLTRPSDGTLTSFLTSSVLMIAQLLVSFTIFKIAFSLTATRTLAPLRASLAMGVVQLAFALLIVRPFVIEAFLYPTKSMSPTIDPGDRAVVNKLIRPRRWDLVTYWTQGAQKMVFCKRLVGLPGERVRFDNGGVYIDDQPVTLPPVLAGRCHASPAAAHGRYRDGETILLGADEFFLIGDDVDRSADSRMLGPTDSASIVGVVDLMYWPINKLRIVR